LAFTSVFRPELLTVPLVITVVFGTMLGSYIVADYYYNKKGDVIR
jgi:hypothetical protein